MRNGLSSSLPVWIVFALLILSGCGQKSAQVTLLYTADTHGRIISDDKVIGLDTIAAVRETTKDSLLVDAGDYLQGNPIVNLSQGRDAVVLMKMAGYFAVAVGNHEFDFGREALLARSAEALAGQNPVHMLSANILKADGIPLMEPAVVTTINGLKIGLFGLTTQETAVQTHPKNVRDLVFADPIPVAETMVKKLRGQGCDIVIALTHVGTADVMDVKSTDIAVEVGGIDVIVDGHSHVELEYAAPNGALVVSSGSHAGKLGKLVLALDRASGAKLRKSNVLLRKEDLAGVTPAPAVREKLAEVKKGQEALLAEVICTAEVDLLAERQVIRTRETNFGNLCADALVQAAGADVAVINGGGIRSSIKKGVITKRPQSKKCDFCFAHAAPGGALPCRTVAGAFSL